MIRKLLIAIFNCAIFMVGLLSIDMYMEPTASFSDPKTWVSLIIAYIIMFRPAMAYWDDKLTNG